jgi:hypothetical protein
MKLQSILLGHYFLNNFSSCSLFSVYREFRGTRARILRCLLDEQRQLYLLQHTHTVSSKQEENGRGENKVDDTFHIFEHLSARKNREDVKVRGDYTPYITIPLSGWLMAKYQ